MDKPGWGNTNSAKFITLFLAKDVVKIFKPKRKNPNTNQNKQGQIISDIKAKRSSLKDQTERSKKEIRSKGKKKDKGTFSFGSIVRTRAKTTIQTIPYVRMAEGNIMILPNGRYSKTYGFTDINYTAARDDDQLAIFSEYSKFINSLATDIIVQIVVSSKSIPIERVYDSIIKKGEFSENKFIDPIFGTDLKKEFDTVIEGYLDQGVNNRQSQRYLSVSIEADNPDAANIKFLNIEASLAKKFKDISKDCQLTEVTNNEKAHMLAEILRGSQIPKPFFEDSDFKNQREKAYIAPDDFKFHHNHFSAGNRYAKCMFLRDISSYMTDELVQSLLSTHIDMTISINIKPVEMSKAKTKLMQKQTNLREVQLKNQLSAARKGIFVDISPRHIIDDLESTEEFHDLVRTKKQSIFIFNFIIMFFADDLDELEVYEEMLQRKAQELSCYLGNMKYQQERAFATCLPIGFNNVSIKRTLPTECVSIFTPFDRLNTLHEGGFFYSLHADTRQAIVLNHNRLKAGNGFILGSSGSGKGMAMKPMVLNILFRTNDDVILVDPENENRRFVNSLGGQSIELSSVSEDYINPFDIPLEDEDFQSGTHPATLKLDLILSIIEAMIGGEVNPAIKSTVDSVLSEIYKPFVKTRDKANLPTFKEFYKALGNENTPIANELLDVLKIYVTGSWSNFANQTNVNIENRLICYNTSKLGEHLKPVGSFLMFDAIWNRIAKNRNSNKNTWIFIDEVHLVFNSEDAIRRVGNMYRRFRKYNGKVISLTQNTSDILRWGEARSMVANSDFLVVMNQKETERREITTLLNIPTPLVGNITNSGKGAGIIFFENMLIPFAAKFPINTRLYELMTTDGEELSIILKKEQEELHRKETLGNGSTEKNEEET